MDKKLIIAYALSMVAFVMMKRHLPGSSLLFFGSIILQVILIVISAIRFKEHRQMSAYYLCCSTLLLYLLNRLMFWPNMHFVEVAVVLGCIHFYIDYKRKCISMLRNVILLAFVSCGIALSFVRTSTFYEYKYGDALVEANSVCYDENDDGYQVAYHCVHWSEYAYYFAIEGNKRDALNALDVSIEIANRGKCKSHICDALQVQRHLIETDHNTVEDLLPTLIGEWDF